MPKIDDNELPASTLGGAQDKCQAELIDGRFVPVEAPGQLHIPRHRVPPIDPKKVADFKHEPGPPSIVDVIVAQHKK